MRKRQIVRFRLRFEGWGGLIGQHDTGQRALPKEQRPKDIFE
jgi:hypothetical protein